MHERKALFGDGYEDDARLAEKVGTRLGGKLPVECVKDVAANVRLMEKHLIVLLSGEG